MEQVRSDARLLFLYKNLTQKALEKVVQIAWFHPFFYRLLLPKWPHADMIFMVLRVIIVLLPRKSYAFGLSLLCFDKLKGPQLAGKSYALTSLYWASNKVVLCNRLIIKQIQKTS